MEGKLSLKWLKYHRVGSQWGGAEVPEYASPPSNLSTKNPLFVPSVQNVKNLPWNLPNMLHQLHLRTLKYWKFFQRRGGTPPLGWRSKTMFSPQWGTSSYACVKFQLLEEVSRQKCKEVLNEYSLFCYEDISINLDKILWKQ